MAKRGRPKGTKRAEKFIDLGFRIVEGQEQIIDQAVELVEDKSRNAFMVRTVLEASEAIVAGGAKKKKK